MRTVIFKFVLISTISLVALSGCALTTDRINLAYYPGPNKLITDAETIKVKAEVIDLRSTKEKVSAKKNGYGMEMAPIESVNDVSEIVSRAINTELSNRGFFITGGGALVRSEISRFWNDFKIGFWAGDAVAELIMSVQIKKMDGSIIFSKIVTGQYVNQNIQLATGENAQIALNGALNDSIQKLVNDPEFIDALLASNKI